MNLPRHAAYVRPANLVIGCYERCLNPHGRTQGLRGTQKVAVCCPLPPIPDANKTLPPTRDHPGRPGNRTFVSRWARCQMVTRWLFDQNLKVPSSWFTPPLRATCSFAAANLLCEAPLTKNPASPQLRAKGKFVCWTSRGLAQQIWLSTRTNIKQAILGEVAVTRV